MESKKVLVVLIPVLDYDLLQQGYLYLYQTLNTVIHHPVSQLGPHALNTLYLYKLCAYQITQHT